MFHHWRNNPPGIPRILFFSASVVFLLFLYVAPNRSDCENNNNNKHRCATFTNALRIGQKEEKNEKRRRRLEFVHIPKTGGTAIESIAKNANLTWSICHFGSPEAVSKMSNGLVECYRPNDTYKRNSNNESEIEKEKKNHSKSIGSKKKNGDWLSGLYWESNHCPWWHVPPAHVEAFYSGNNNPYEGADLFVVVRNPYDRIISEYYYAISELQASRNNHNKTIINDDSNLNKILHKQLSEFSSQMMTGDASRGIPGNKMYYSHDGHLIPQYDFVYDKHNGHRMVEHVLFFENFQTDFSNLMAEYELPLTLPKTRVRPKSEKKLGVWNLTLENMLLIEDIYRDDFLEFGYKLLSKDFI